MDSNIIKLDRPYPLVTYGNRVLPQIGTLFTYSEEKAEGRGYHKTVIKSESYPILSDINERGEAAFLPGMHQQDYWVICREGDSLYPSEIADASGNIIDEVLDEAERLYKEDDLVFMPKAEDIYLWAKTLWEDYGCRIKKVDTDRDTITCDLWYECFLGDDGRPADHFYLYDHEGWAFFIEIGDVQETAEKLYRNITFYNTHYLTAPKRWRFRLHEKDYKEQFLTEYTRKELHDPEAFLNELNEALAGLEKEHGNGQGSIVGDV